MTRTIINISDLMGQDWKFLEPFMEDRDLRWQVFTTSGQQGAGIPRRIRRIQACLNAVRSARRSENAILVTHLPNMAAITNAIRGWNASSVPQIAFSFNFTDLPTGLRRSVFRKFLNSIDEFVAFSQYEQQLYTRELGIPAEKFRVIKWSMEQPAIGPVQDPPVEQPYLCAIGGEARDYGLLAQAMASLPHRNAVIVAREYSIAGIDFPENVIVHTDLPSANTWRIVADSVGMVLPLVTRDTACGVITLVGCQLLGRPVVATESLGINEYLDAVKPFRKIQPKDLAALSGAIEDLFDLQDEANQSAAQAQTIAETEYAIGGWVSYLDDAIERLLPIR